MNRHPQRDSKSEAEELLIALREARDSEAVEGKEVGKLIEKLRKALNLTADEFAKRCHVSVATYRRWVNGLKPPRHRLDRFNLLAQNETPEERTKDSIFSGDCRMTIRTLEQILDRQTKCRRIWSFKHNLPFRAANHGISRETLLDFLTDPQHNTVFNCVFFGSVDRGDGAVSQFPALESFACFKKALFELNRPCSRRFRGWLVKDEATAFRLGLSNHFFGVNILEYDPTRTKDMPHLAKREVDYFFEIPLSLYMKENHLQLVGGEEIRWLELTADKSHWDWQARKELLLRLEKGEMREQGVTEFLATAGDIETFVPKRWLD